MGSELFDYGIHNEASHIRAHVAPLAKTLFVFPTICGRMAIKGKSTVSAFQPGIEQETARGVLVPPSSIPHIRALKISDEHLVGFNEELSTTEKGNRAVEIVHIALKRGRFPLWFDGEFINDVDMQTTETDIRIRGQWKIEVKCDYRASKEKGTPHPRCTGNLFLQVAERNPLKMH